MLVIIVSLAFLIILAVVSKLYLIKQENKKCFLSDQILNRVYSRASMVNILFSCLYGAFRFAVFRFGSFRFFSVMFVSFSLFMFVSALYIPL